MKVQVSDVSAAYQSESIEIRETKDGSEVVLLFDKCMHQNVEEEYDQLFCSNQECNMFVRVVEHEEDDFDYSDNLRENNYDRGY